MTVLYLVIFILLSGGIYSLLLGHRFAACFVAAAAVMAAAVLGFVFSAHLLYSGEAITDSLNISVPLGSCTFMADQLTAAFLLPVFLLSFIGGLLLPVRMRSMASAKSHYGRHGFFFCLLIVGMVLALTAADSVFFLISWEVMSLAPFFLLAHQDKDSKERFSGWVYLVAAHLGVLPLLLLFAGMGIEAGDTGFAAFAAYHLWDNAGLLFVLALIGFGLKIGLFPLHVWMPETYPVAPGHVAVILSGAMVNMGLYGILRVLMLLGLPAMWWAHLLMIVGAVSGVLGVLLALAQQDIKRALAYSSSENMGVIILAIGGGLLAFLHGALIAAVLLFSGALLHMWNHSLFKGLWFLGASAVSQGIGTSNINQLGGLQKRMPYAGGCMAVATASISGAPPFNGFVGELLMYMGFIAGALATKGLESNLVFLAGLFALAGIAGFSLLCFSRLYGLVFLGAPRSSAVHHGQCISKRWRFAMLFLAALCLFSSLASPGLFLGLLPAIKDLFVSIGTPVSAVADIASSAPDSFLLSPAEEWAQSVSQMLAEASPRIAGQLQYLSGGCALLIVITGFLVFCRRQLVQRNSCETGLTWDCGYRYPTARMQYTGGSFAQFPLYLLRSLIHSRIVSSDLTADGDYFPRGASARLEAPDWASSFWQRIVFQGFASIADMAKDVQQGVVNLYILYILIALIATLVWALGWS